MFSVIIPTLNEQNNIKKVVRQFSSIKSKYNIEIIVSDSGSTDQTIDIARKYCDKVISYPKDNCNISKARNYGAKHAENEVFIFLDADIFIDNINSFFEIIINFIKRKDIIAISPRISIYPKEETIIDKCIHFIITLISNILNRIGFSYSRGGCQVISKKDFNKVNGYNEKFVAAEDVDIFRRLRKLGRTIIINKLHVYESPRRYRKEGYCKTLYYWFMNWLYTLCFNRSYSTKW
tara:strand:+ start:802 stop:1506 length:705 start_codon:yes stop_codon:yes gene_type:complete